MSGTQETFWVHVVEGADLLIRNKFVASEQILIYKSLQEFFFPLKQVKPYHIHSCQVLSA